VKVAVENRVTGNLNVVSERNQPPIKGSRRTKKGCPHLKDLTCSGRSPALCSFGTNGLASFSDTLCQLWLCDLRLDRLSRSAVDPVR
jgi:hypothetical protein